VRGSTSRTYLVPFTVHGDRHHRARFPAACRFRPARVRPRRPPSLSCRPLSPTIGGGIGGFRGLVGRSSKKVARRFLPAQQRLGGGDALGGRPGRATAIPTSAKVRRRQARPHGRDAVAKSPTCVRSSDSNPQCVPKGPESDSSAISPSATAVVERVDQKSSIATTRVPRPANTTCAREASAATAQSPAGSLWQRLPTTVPICRTTGSATTAETSAMSG